MFRQPPARSSRRGAKVWRFPLLFDKGHAVGAGVLGRVTFVGADGDAGEAAIVLAAAVVAAGFDVALDRAVRRFHKTTSFRRLSAVCGGNHQYGRMGAGYAAGAGQKTAKILLDKPPKAGIIGVYDTCRDGDYVHLSRFPESRRVVQGGIGFWTSGP